MNSNYGEGRDPVWFEVINDIVDKADASNNMTVSFHENRMLLKYTTVQAGINTFNEYDLVDGYVDDFVKELSSMFKEQYGSALKITEAGRENTLSDFGMSRHGKYYVIHTRVYEYTGD